MTINGMVGVHSAIERPKSQRGQHDDIPTRLVNCPNGHGAIGQVYVASVRYWAGECRDCGARPQE